MQIVKYFEMSPAGIFIQHAKQTQLKFWSSQALNLDLAESTFSRKQF